MGRRPAVMEQRFVARQGEVLSRLRQRYPVHSFPWEALQRTFLDTADWRLFRAGARLLLEEGPQGAQLLWKQGDERLALPVAGAPRFATDLPECTIRRRLAALAQVRALLPVGRQRVRRRRVLVLDGDGKTVARVHLETTTAEDRRGQVAAPAVRSVVVEGLPGYETAFQRVTSLLAPARAAACPGDDGLHEAAERWGRTPGEVPGLSTLHVEPDLPAPEAVRRILLAQLAAIQANLDGVVADVDTEFLHDLRVAVRRTRSALGQLGDLLPAVATPTVVEEFRWLGSVTGTCRDLDVFRLHVNALAERFSAGESEALGPFLTLLAEQRAAAHREVAEALTSARCRTLLRRFWRTLAAPRRRGNAIGTLAGIRIAKAYRRVLRRGAAAAAAPRDPALLHRLRIAGKKLRYLLEFFASLYPEDTVGCLVGRLKALQDALGAYHDAAVQRNRIGTLAEELTRRGTVRAATFLAMGRLAGWLEEEGERHREEVGPLLQALATPVVRWRLPGRAASREEERRC